MICDPQLRDEVTEAVSQSPGISVKKLVSLLNAQRGSLNLRKGPINRILYGNADRFRYEGHNPPRWYIRQRNEVPGETERRTDKSHQTPVPTKVDPPAGQQDYFIKTRRDSRRRPGISESVDIPLTAPVFGGVLSKELYSWQEKAIASWGKSGCRGVVEAVTGTGKTFVAISLINQYIQDRKRCLVVVPSQILMRQWKEELENEFGITITSLLGGGHGDKLDLGQWVTLGVVNSVVTAQQSGALDCEFGLLVADECHRFGSDQFQHALLESADHRLGLTATFERTDDAVTDILLPYFSASGTGETGDEISGTCFQYDFKKATEDQVIAPYILGSVSVELTDEEREQYDYFGSVIAKCRQDLIMGYDYSRNFKSFLRRAQRPAKLREEGILCQKFFGAIRARRKLLSESGEKEKVVAKLEDLIGASSGALIYTETIESAKRLASLFTVSGVTVEAYHSELGKQDRDQMFDRFREHQTDCLIAVHTLDEGINVPEANLAVIVAGSQQRRQMIQRMGRILRKKFNDSGATFVHIYAEDTAEDPFVQQGDEGYLSILREHATSQQNFLAVSLGEGDILGWVNEEKIWMDSNAP